VPVLKLRRKRTALLVRSFPVATISWLNAPTQLPKLPSLFFCFVVLRCHVGRDFDPIPGRWYEDLDEEVIFQVMTVDPDEELVQLQYENGEIEEIDLDTWHELDLDEAQEPEGWSSASEEDEDDEDWDEEEEEDEDDWDEDEDDDWDDDDDDDYDDRDDD
jgi:hypothetical protein